jgi:hypothetical protein
MSDEEEVLELGPRRPHSTLLLIVAAVLLAGGIGAYAVLHERGDHPHRQALTTPTPPASSTPAPLPTAPGSIGPGPDGRPPWPQRAGACGNTAFLPLVSARPLDHRTGVRAVVGDRLTGVDVDTGAVQPVRGLPKDEYATQIVTAGGATYALLSPCAQVIGAPARVVRVTADGRAETVARGPYDYLIGGGDHPWALIWAEAEDRTTVDALDGTKRHRLPASFGPIAGYRDYLIGTEGTSTDSGGHIVGLDPRTGKERLDLGRASWVAVSQGIVAWAEPGCRRCRLHILDLATGKRSVTRRAIADVPSSWGGVASPDHRTFVLLRQSATPARYDMDHPGNPNEIVTVDLVTGAVTPVPGVRLWSKSMPGLDFSADSRWLLISLDEGTGTRLLLWHPGLPAVQQSPARLTDRNAYSPGLATVG